MTLGMTGFHTAIGECGVAWGDDGIRSVMLPSHSELGIAGELRKRHGDGEPLPPPSPIQQAIDRMVRLLAGESADDLRDVAIDFGEASDFSRQVWEITRTVGPGETTTYGEIARQLGQPHAAREVGQALGRNPVPIIVPCHRVLGAGGKLVGFSAPGGVHTKIRMLHIEGAAFEGQPALF
ncbi:MAG: methylated-DNA--[protein]-cysteine S-methyltransferase [Frankiaceae bacterium]|nr:methylated-DNA--[protein]-cysteine S-methyltransferase [Frankiaceae bacterium]